MSDTSSSPSDSKAVGKRRRLYGAAGGVVVVAGLAVTLWHPWQRPDPLAAFANVRFIDSVAVLTIENRTGDPAMEHLSAGLAEEVVGRLKGVGVIKVSDPYSVQTLTALELTTRQLADSLGVERLILGSLYRTANGVRLNMRVSNGATGDIVSTRWYEWNSSDGMDTAYNLAQLFVEDYVAAMPLVEVPGWTQPTAHSPGHESYLVGKTWLGRRTAEGLSRAHAAFAKAIAEDSAYADAYSGLSNVYALTLAYRYRIGIDGYRAAGLALALADRAIKIDPNRSAGYAARGYIASRSFAPVGQVASDCRRAIDLEPGAADILSWCARVLNQRGETDAAFRVAEQAITMDPQNAGRRLALAYDALALGLYDRAVGEAHLAGQLEPDLMLPRAIEARAHLLAGRAKRCAGMELGPHAGIRAMCLHELNRREAARAIVDSLVAGLGNATIPDRIFTDVVRVEDLATYYAWIGDADASLEWVARAFQLSPSGVEPRVLESALFEHVRDDPRFKREVESIRSGIWERVRRESQRGL